MGWAPGRKTYHLDKWSAPDKKAEKYIAAAGDSGQEKGIKARAFSWRGLTIVLAGRFSAREKLPYLHSSLIRARYRKY